MGTDSFIKIDILLIILIMHPLLKFELMSVFEITLRYSIGIASTFTLSAVNTLTFAILGPFSQYILLKD